jgi:hypothetical protein
MTHNWRRLFVAVFGAMVIVSLQPMVVVAGVQQSTSSHDKPADLSPEGELALWMRIKDSIKVKDFRNYLELFPNGMFVKPASKRYEELTGVPYVAGDQQAVGKNGKTHKDKKKSGNKKSKSKTTCTATLITDCGTPATTQKRRGGPVDDSWIRGGGEGGGGGGTGGWGG